MTTPFPPTDRCPACTQPRPWHHPCPCGDPGGMPRMLPADHESWKPSERRLYANAAIRVLGEEDTAGRLLCQVMDGPLAGECRWFTVSELYATGQDAAVSGENGPRATEGEVTAESDVNGHPNAPAAKITGRQVEEGSDAA